MPVHNVMWVDNHIKTNPEFQSVMKQISKSFKDRHTKVEWTCAEDPVEAEELLNKQSGFRLAILDQKYDKERRGETELVLKAIQDRGIPYFFFTIWPEELKRFSELIDNHFCLAIIKKDFSSPNELINKVRSFLIAPSFRIIHLGDLHFSDANMTNPKTINLYNTLIKHLADLSASTPFDILVFSGDFAVDNQPNDLGLAREKVSEIISACIGQDNLERSIIVPGNHEMQWQNYSAKLYSKNPWVHYLDFYKSIYSKRKEILREMVAWNAKKKMYPRDSFGKNIMFYRSLYDKTLSVIGLSTTVEEISVPFVHGPYFKPGTGMFTDEHRAFIDNHWSRKKSFDSEFRLTVFHHNVIPPISLNHAEEKNAIENSGECLRVLLENKCDLVLSGHTHTLNAIRINAANYETAGFSPAKDIMLVSTGAVNAPHGSSDRPRMFNVIDVSPFDFSSGKRSFRITPHFFEGDAMEWKQSAKSVDF